MTAWVTAAASLAVAALAALLAYRNNDLLHRRQERLARINAQIGEFYGPLYSLLETSQASWLEFRKQNRPGDHYFFEGPALDVEERVAWKRWMGTIFMPSNRNVRDLIVTKSHLLAGDEMPPCLLEFCAHVATYEVILQEWADGDDGNLNSPIPWPENLRPYVREAFHELKIQQQDLLYLVRPLSIGHFIRAMLPRVSRWR